MLYPYFNHHLSLNIPRSAGPVKMKTEMNKLSGQIERLRELLLFCAAKSHINSVRYRTVSRWNARRTGAVLTVRARYVGMIWLPRALSILCTVQYGSLFPAKSKTNPEFSTHPRDLCIFFFHMAKRSSLALAFASAGDSQSKKKRKTHERGKEKNGKKKIDSPNRGPYCRESFAHAAAYFGLL